MWPQLWQNRAQAGPPGPAGTGLTPKRWSSLSQSTLAPCGSFSILFLFTSLLLPSLSASSSALPHPSWVPKISTEALIIHPKTCIRLCPCRLAPPPAATAVPPADLAASCPPCPACPAHLCQKAGPRCSLKNARALQVA